MPRRLVDAGMQADVVDGDADAPDRRGFGRGMNKAAARQRPALHRARLVRFVAVGCAAAAVHWLVVVLLVSQWQLAPLLANVPAWLTAFVVSFSGHHRLTFNDHQAPVGSSLRRFFMVSALGFVLNQGAYAAMLRFSGQRYDVALLIVLVAVAALTYLLSLTWAFNGRR